MSASIPIENFAARTPAGVPLKKQSKLGVLSLLIAIAFPFPMLIVSIVLVLLQDYIENGAFVGFVTILAASIAGFAVHLTGLILGIAGVSRKETKKLLPVLGILFNALPLALSLIVCILFVAFLIHPFPLGPK
jgi:hypothetical protein